MDRLEFLFYEQIFWLTDTIIAGFLHLGISCLVGTYIVIASKTTKNRIKTALILSAAGVGILTFLIWGIFVEPNSISVIEKTVDLDDYSGEPVYIALISDLHLGRFNNNQRFINAIDVIESDERISHVLILGDAVNTSNKHLSALEPLNQISGEKEVFFVFGNHDYTSHLRNDEDRTVVEGLTEKLANLGVTILENDLIEISSATDDPIILAGIADLWSKQCDFEFLEEVDPEATCILMSHNPDAVMNIKDDLESPAVVDLVVSGHTHSGEMHLPIIGPIWHLPIKIPQSYDDGYFTYDGLPLYITSGLGNVGIRMRTLNPPEVVILEIL